jgi:hypothetical protein
LRVGEDPAFGESPFLAADEAVIRVRAWALLRGRLETSGLLVRRPRVELVRDASGTWNVASLGAGPDERGDEGREGEPGERRSAAGPGVLLLGLVRGDIRDGTIVVRDLAGAHPREVTIARVRVRTDNVYAGGDARVRIEAAVRSERPNVRLDLRVPALGARDVRDTPFELDLEGDAIDLTPFGGVLRATEVTRLAVDARGTPENMNATLEAAWTRSIKKRKPTVGTFRARASREGERVKIEEVVGDTAGIAWTANGALALGDDGTRVDELHAVVDGVPVEITGRVGALAPPKLDLRFTGQPYGGSLEGSVVAEGDGAAHLRGECGGVDLAAIGARIGTEDARRLAGRVGGNVDVRVGEKPAHGSGELRVTEGRIGGVNLARLILGAFDAIPMMPSVFETSGSPELAGPDTNIERATIPFTIADHRVRSERVQLVGTAFEVVGDGWIDAERQLRFRGDLVLAPQVSKVLTSGLGVLRILSLDDARLSVPFRVRGRLGKAKIEPDLGRLGDRGLALFGRRAKSADDDEHRDSRPGRRIGEALLDSLEKLVEP